MAKDITHGGHRVGRVRAQVGLECTDPWGRTVRVPTTLSYQSGDPYAISLTFHVPDGDVTWLVARDVVLEGLTHPAGDGDVRVFPSIGDDAAAVVVLVFSSPEGDLIAEVSTRELHAFLARTLVLVPKGTESAYLDVDALVDALRATA